ncbi:hypothetical protein BDY19DRAFT_942682 [Irpex rosettiformis]|uniref:Uncharacterized protein n=1 Tax=Irpex rosettiformis TaxID=378272 RepID=A0ACB8U5V3_9APHY|nr:hypothetical protein BDY19DRAFT_942682 [Irpex rosettiformis]
MFCLITRNSNGNAKLALKLADTDIHLWADLTSKQRSIVVGGTGNPPVNRTPSRPSNALGGLLSSTPTRTNLTFIEAPARPQKSERKSHVAAARLFLRRSLHGFKKHECVACQHMVMDTNAVRVPCGHFYDIPCLLSLVKASTRDESIFPPRCCQDTVPSSLFEKHMDTQLSRLFSLKTQEFSTPKRVYCARVTCNRFLGPRTKSKNGPPHAYDCTESGCTTRTCSRCRCEVKKHVLHACRPDNVPRRLVQRGCAQQCPGCDRLVELKSGCFHITCACKTQFCYRCGTKWKTCKCPLWEEGRLTTGAAGGDDAARPPSVPLLPPVPRPDRFRQTWLHPPPERPIEPPPKRRPGVRSSAPAQLQGYIPARETVVLRGIEAQERRVKHKEELTHPASPKSTTSRSTIDTRRLDALEEHIDRLIYEVQRYKCQHDWRMSLRSAKRRSSSCACGDSAVYHCSSCSTVACMRCRCSRTN